MKVKHRKAILLKRKLWIASGRRRRGEDDEPDPGGGGGSTTDPIPVIIVVSINEETRCNNGSGGVHSNTLYYPTADIIIEPETGWVRRDVIITGDQKGVPAQSFTWYNPDTITPRIYESNYIKNVSFYSHPIRVPRQNRDYHTYYPSNDDHIIFHAEGVDEIQVRDSYGTGFGDWVYGIIPYPASRFIYPIPGWCP